MELFIRKGKSDELTIVFDLLYNAAIWLKNEKVDYWQNWLAPSELHLNWIKEGLDNGEFYFVYSNEDIIVGMYRLQYSDEMFWGKRNDKAGYIHSFTTNREYKGKKIGFRILESIEKGLLEIGSDYLRLDCSPDIKGLCKYYEDYGFEPRETVIVHGQTLRLYEKKMTTIARN